MRHYYVGVEHLFVALLGVHGGIASSLLEAYGLTPDYVIDAIRRHTGKGGRHRLWAGMPNSPRADMILSIANDLALGTGREEIEEADLLLAIFEESDSIPIRVLTRLGLDIGKLVDQTVAHGKGSSEAQPYIRIDFGSDYDSSAPLTEEQLFILRRMFHGYQQIRIEMRLAGGYSGAVLLVVTPRRMDGFEDSPVVAKIDRADDILDEARRYETNVRNTLPPLTARLEDKPTAPETSDHAGLKYTFVSDGSDHPRDLRLMAVEWGTQALGQWLVHNLLPTFGKTWWLQRRPYRFQISAEYDWMLPPAITLEALEGEEAPENATILRDPIKRSRLQELDYDQTVVLENFTVEKVFHDRKTIRLSGGKTATAARGFKIEVTGIDMTHTTYFRGELVDRLVGRVFKTRAEVLRLAAGDLMPNFDLRAEFIPGVGPIEKLPNPLLAYDDLLDRYVNSSLSKIHGDLHLGNILVGPGKTPFLIDFAHARDGHTLVDWATLEVSLLAEVVIPAAGQDWKDVRRVIATMIALNGRGAPPEDSDDFIVNAMITVAAVRTIAEECMLVRTAWLEYFVALAFCSLRALMWPTMSLGARRLMFLVSALSIYELRRRARLPGSAGSMETSPDVEMTDSGM